MSEMVKDQTWVNGMDVEGLKVAIEEIADEPAKGRVRFAVESAWKGQTLSETVVKGFDMGGDHVARTFCFSSDEPLELFGGNSAPNPQEYLMGALNACMLVGYAANAALRGIRLEKLEIESEGELDLRGFLGIDADVKPGYDAIRTTVRVKADATPEQLAEIHEAVQATSPNYFNVTQPVRVDADLIVE